MTTRTGTGRPAAPRLLAAPRPVRLVPAATGRRVLDLLRGEQGRRPAVDPGLAGGLRAWLEDGVCRLAAHLPDGPPVVVSRRMAQTAPGGSGAGAADSSSGGIGGGGGGGGGGGPTVTVPMARGALVGNLFRQLVTTGRIDHPMGDAMAALMVDPTGSDVARLIESLRPAERAELAADVARHASTLRRDWARLPARWLPRTRDRVTVPLAGGRIVLASTPDLLIGTPSSGRASVCVVELVAGSPRPEHRAGLHFSALLETLRSGAAPFRAVSYYTPSGETRAEDLTDAHLAAAVEHTIEVIHQACAGIVGDAGDTGDTVR